MGVCKSFLCLIVVLVLIISRKIMMFYEELSSQFKRVSSTFLCFTFRDKSYKQKSKQRSFICKLYLLAAVIFCWWCDCSYTLTHAKAFTPGHCRFIYVCVTTVWLLHKQYRNDVNLMCECSFCYTFQAARFLKYGNRLLFVKDLERHLEDLEHTKGFFPVLSFCGCFFPVLSFCGCFFPVLSFCGCFFPVLSFCGCFFPVLSFCAYFFPVLSFCGYKLFLVLD